MTGQAADPAVVLDSVRARITERHLSPREAALEIGVGVDRLVRHLSGDYVRSDSLAKYRRWLAGGMAADSPAAAKDSLPRVDEWDVLAEIPLAARSRRHEPAVVVDLFSGCGGMSLGFDLVESGNAFRTTLAIDIEEPMVRAYNANLGEWISNAPVCRRIDLADFMSEAEVLGFYLDHLARVRQDQGLASRLTELPRCGLRDLVGAIARADLTMLQQLREIRGSAAYREATSALPPGALGQTSVAGFFSDVALPLSTATDTSPLVWADGDPHAGDLPADFEAEVDEIASATKARLAELWDAKVNALQGKAAGRAGGQLASSATRIATFHQFLRSQPMQAIRERWLDWRTRRDSLRFAFFEHEGVRSSLRELYAASGQVDVLLGGPPCQGFSRIGRGKIRSLRDHSVQAHYDPDAGDERNKLLFAYVLFVSALAPRAFLFENVRHFQARVSTPDGTFLASEVLEEAIRDLSETHLGYHAATRILHAADHLVPQLRERFFMVGVRSDLPSAKNDIARWILAVPRSKRLPLKVALNGLGDPNMVAGPRRNSSLAATVPVKAQASGAGPEAEYASWVGQPRPGLHGKWTPETDAHTIRPPRNDDRELFARMGPGTRWMDYRCDLSLTLQQLQDALAILARTVKAAHKVAGSAPGVAKLLQPIRYEDVERLIGLVDGSLSLRLLLESIEPEPGEMHHHLLAENYLAKRDGNHGDWLARLDPERPSKTVVSHMGKDTYAYVHPYQARTLSVREAARIQSFPDWFSFGCLSFVDAFRVVGNAVPPLLSHQLAQRVHDALMVGYEAEPDIDTELAAALQVDLFEHEVDRMAI